MVTRPVKITWWMSRAIGIYSIASNILAAALGLHSGELGLALICSGIAAASWLMLLFLASHERQSRSDEW